MKHPATSFLDYCRDFGKAMRESIQANNKLVCQILQPYRKSYYPIPKLAMNLSANAKLNPIPVVSLDKTSILKMREWASEHGQCVRQLTVKQQTTKFSAGTLPMSAYGLNLQQDPLNSICEEFIEEYDSDSDSSLSSPQLSEDEEMEIDVVAPLTLKTRNSRQIKVVVRLDL